jgi:hypothetical protein
VVSVADIIWQRQMQSMSTELISRINKLLGREVVEEIEFRIDPATVEQVRANSQLSPQEKPRGPIPEELIAAADEIADHDLRERFIRAAENCIARREARTST